MATNVTYKNNSLTSFNSGTKILKTAGKYMEDNVTITTSAGSATTPATTITANPTISVNSSGLITATTSATQNITPTVSAGYVGAGTAGTVTVSGSKTQQLSTQAATTITPSTTQQTAVAAGKYTTGAVTVAAMPSGTEGTPTATKGTVSNHSVSVTPSVTNTAGYISGSTKTGTAVTVSASELVSGIKSITENGTGIDVINYASVNVNVPSDDFIITFAKNQNDEWMPDCTYTQAYSAYSAGKTIAVTTGGDEAVSINVDSDMGFINCRVYEPFDNVISSSISNIGAKVTNYTWSSRGMSENYSYITYDASGTDAVPSDVANGKLFVNSQGVQTGTLSSPTYVNGDNLAYGGN